MTLNQRFDPARVEPGFADPVHDAQESFRIILDVLAHPGRIRKMSDDLARLPPAPLSRAAAAVALTLCDLDTPVWLDKRLAPAALYLAFHCGCACEQAPADARFAFVGAPADLPPLDAFALGSDEYPDRSTTLVVEVAALAGGPAVRLAGPGIRDEAPLAIAGVPERLWTERAALEVLFPRGLDILFASGNALVALPRSARVIA